MNEVNIDTFTDNKNCYLRVIRIACPVIEVQGKFSYIFLNTALTKIREALHPVIYAFSVIPSILLSPFVLLLSPTLLSASIFFVVYNIVWATLFATITGIMTIDKRYLDKAATLELTGVKRFMKVILPAASPSILAGFVNSLRSSFVMLVFAEMYGGGSGMGYFVKKNSELGVFANTWVGFIFMVIVLVVVMQIFEKVKEQLLKWTID